MILACDPPESTAVYLSETEAATIRDNFIISALDLSQAAAELRQTIPEGDEVHDHVLGLLRHVAAISAALESRGAA